MTLTRRLFAVSAVATLAQPTMAADVTFELQSLSSRGKWRSLGVEDWTRFNPYERATPGAVRQPYDQFKLRRSGGATGQLLDLIAFAEAGKSQYDAVHHGARQKPPGRPTQLTVGQIVKWIKATPGQPHAIGRYQFIPSTLASLLKRANIAPSARFSPGLQDKLAGILLHDAGYSKFNTGKISMSRFMDNLAKIWAGLPLRNGRSAYDGYAGNRATISRSFYTKQMTAIFA